MANGLLSAAIVIGATLAQSNSPMAEQSVREHLFALARDYENDPLAVPGEFGVEVDQRTWSVQVSREQGRRTQVVVTAGEPTVPTFVFQTDSGTFGRIASGELSAATAMGKARASEDAPMEVRFVNGFKPDDNFRTGLLSILQHFWTTGTPETISFGFEHARTVHGGEAVVLHYLPGHLRSAWYGIRPGQHVNREPRDQVNDYDTVIVVLRAGSVKARLGGKIVDLQDRTSVRIPAGMTHEFWNAGDEPGELIMMAFGPKA